MRKALLVFFVFSAFCIGYSKPLVLVVQEQVQEFTDRDPNLDVMRGLSKALDENGKVQTVIWSDADPIIAAAFATGKAGKFTKTPKIADVQRLNRVLKADYVAYLKASYFGGSLKGQIEFYEDIGRKPIFTDETTTAILKDGVLDEVSSSMSLVNTWLMKLVSGPLKGLPGGANVQNPLLGDPTVTPTAILPIDKAPFESGMAALQKGDVISAVASLRDAVDADPSNPEVRLALIEALRRADKPFLAADEAQRAADTIPTDSRLILAAAECWLAGGKPERAMDLVNKSLAANPKNATAKMLLGDLQIGSLQFQKAVDTYSEAIELEKDPEIYYRRAQAYALLEQFPKSIADLDEAKKLGLSQDERKVTIRYENNVRSLEPVFVSLATSVRNLLAEAKSFPDTKGLDVRAAEIGSRCASFSDYLDKVVPPQFHQKSHAQRALATNLLLQSSLGLQKFLVKRDVEMHGDATLLQIEAMREFASAQAQYLKEQNTQR